MSAIITSKQLFFHPLSKTGFETQDTANSDYKIKLKEKEDQDQEVKKIQDKQARIEELKNYVRLNLESISDLAGMLETNIKEIFGYTFNLNIRISHFGNISNSHQAPIGKKTNWNGDKNEPTFYLGWQGSITGDYFKDKTVSDCFGVWAHNGIKGFHTNCGGGNNSTFRYQFCFFLDDFPKLKKKYSDYAKFKENFLKEREEYEEKYDEWKSQIHLTHINHSQVIENNQKIEELQRQINTLVGENNAINTQILKDNPFKFKIKYIEETLKEKGVNFNF